VSVVIPVHGKWRFTRACLTALHATASAVPFEIIVVDDKSPDASLRRLRRVHGIRVVALTENQGFVGACNAGIAVSRGSLIVLLNNDTRVSTSWLDPLVERMQDPTIGLAGARLIYPDGTLQDAGGIVFNDGSAANYGKHRAAEVHDYAYARDADYVSGACIIVRKETLDALGGGLDPRFAPAYYDDTDLAFGVRSLGLRVVYEPRSVVIHDEGISHGTDETKGVKRYQSVNQEKFAEKWAAELSTHPDRDLTQVARHARRRPGLGIVVVIDDIVPTPDVGIRAPIRFAGRAEATWLSRHLGPRIGGAN
jgi:GT2 family glycosyltransferase